MRVSEKAIALLWLSLNWLAVKGDKRHNHFRYSKSRDTYLGFFCLRDDNDWGLLSRRPWIFSVLASRAEKIPSRATLKDRTQKNS